LEAIWDNINYPKSGFATYSAIEKSYRGPYVVQVCARVLFCVCQVGSYWTF